MAHWEPENGERRLAGYGCEYEYEYEYDYDDGRYL